MKKIFSVFLALIIMAGYCLIAPVPVSALPAEPTPDFTGQGTARSGSGSDVDPYIIHNVAQLQDIELDLDAFYELGNDIDASGGDDFVTISVFTGSLDGQGHGIYDLHVGNITDAFIGELDSSDGFGLLADISFVDNDCPIVYTSSGQLTGVYVYTDRYHLYGDIDSSLYYFSGLLHDNTGYISNCGFSGSINVELTWAYASMAGIVDTNAGIIENTAYEGDLIVTDAVSGDNEYTEVSGFARLNSGTIQTSYFNGNIDYHETGVQGDCTDGTGFCMENTVSGTIENCYAKGEIIHPDGLSDSGYSQVFVKNNDNYITNCYGAIISQNYFNVNVSALCSYNGGTITDSYFDDDIIYTTYFDGGGEEKTTLEMLDPATYATWDFDNVWAIDEGTNDGYPYLLMNDPLTFTVTINDIEVVSDGITSAPTSAENWVWGGIAAPYIDSVSITVGGAPVLLYQPNEIIAGTTLPDRDGTENGVITWGANPEGVAPTLETFGPVQPSPSAPMPRPTLPGVITGIPSPIPGMFTPIATNTIPGKDIPNKILDDSGIPRDLWWYPFIYLGICVIGFIVYGATRIGGAPGSVFIMVIAMEILIAVFAVMGAVPFFPVFLFPLPALAFTIKQNHFSWG